MSDHSQFSPDDFKDAGRLVLGLRDAHDPFTQLIRAKFSPKTEALFDDSASTGVLESVVIEEFNRLLEDPDFLRDARRCARVVLTDEARALEEQGTERNATARLNRLILEGAYPHIFRQTHTPGTGVHVDKTLFTTPIKLGPRTSHSLKADPRHMLFVLARYKFCAKLLQGKRSVLEVGCGDAFGSPIVAQVARRLLGVDRESVLIEGDKERLMFLKNVKFQTIDITEESPDGTFDAAFSIDVIEHIKPDEEPAFLSNICRGLSRDGILIIGTPNIEADRYSSDPGANPHINLKSHMTLKESLDGHFVHSFIFSMNDEIVHTGFYPMAHYLFGVGICQR